MIGYDGMSLSGWRFIARGAAVLCLTIVIGGGSSALAQTVGTAIPSVPSVKILRGTLVTPGSNYLDNQTDATATDGLCRDYGSNVDICPAGSSGAHPRAPEIKELARSLKNDPDLIYEFVRNSVDTEFMFGAHKGALGVIIDHSGTAFDQAELMVELLRESGFTARYRFGTVSLTKDQFAAWTGISQAKAACDFLALGGIPATVGGGCASTADTTGVVMDHIWVEADIGGQTYFFDSAYKPYEFKAGLNVRTMMSLSANPIMTAAGASMSGEQTGSIAGTTYVDGVNSSQVSSTLAGMASTLVGNIRSASPDLGGASVTDLVGGRIIEPATRPAGGWRQTTPGSYTAARSWTAVPNLYRARLKLNAGATASGSIPAKTFVSADFFADEVYGRRLIIRSSPDGGDASTAATWKPELSLDGVKIQTGDSMPGPMAILIKLDIQADHPFAADSGSYGDATASKTLDILQPAFIVASWGQTSPALAGKWDSEQVTDSPGYVMVTSIVSEGTSPTPSSGDKLRANIAASWLGQYTAVTDLNAQLAGGRVTTLHTLGVVGADQRVVAIPSAPGETSPTTFGYTVYDEVTVVDLETSLGLVSKTSDPDTRRGGIRAIALTASVLEGSVVTQATGSPDAASAPTRLAWGNAPEFGETRSVARRRAYRFSPPTTAYTYTAVKGLTVYDGGSTAPPADGPVPAIPQATVDFMESRLTNTILAYSQAGFDVAASSESSLGPGHRIGSGYAAYTVSVFGFNGSYVLNAGIECIIKKANSQAFSDNNGNPDPCQDAMPVGYTLEASIPFGDVSQAGTDATYTLTAYDRLATIQRGGAIVAVKYETGTSDPSEIAYVVTRLGLMSKGGGGPSVSQAAAFNPGESPDTLKSRFIDRSAAAQVDPGSGQAGFVTPPLVSVGTGEFPNRLESRGELRGGGLAGSPDWDAPFSFPQAEMVSNWQVRANLGSSGYEALGRGRIEAAAPAIVAFVVMQDIYQGGEKSAQRELTGAVVGDWWSKQILFNVVTLDQGGLSEQYIRLPDGSYVPAGGGSARLTLTGSPQLVRPPRVTYHDRNPQEDSTVRAWKFSGITMSVTSAQGDTRSFGYYGVPPIFGDGSTVNTSILSQQVDEYHYWQLTGWTFPGGVHLTVTYPDFLTVGHNIQVDSNLGYTLNVMTPGGACGAPLTVQDQLGATTKLTFYAQVLRSTTQRPNTTCMLKEVYDRTDATTPALSYVYDSVGRIKEARDGVAIRTPAARGPNLFYFAPGYRFERADPLGGTYSAETLRNGRRSRIIDELGRVVTSDFDGRGRLLTRTYPEGDQEVFTYDVRGNPLSLTKVPKPGASPPPSLTSSMTYVEGPTVWACSNLVVCNKPATADGPRTDVTDVTNFSWNTTTGLLTQVLKPADGAGVRPQIDFTYTQFGSAIWLPTSRTEKISGTTGDTIITNFEYGTTAPYLMMDSIVDPSGLALKTCYAYDPAGNINAVTSPLATSCPTS